MRFHSFLLFSTSPKGKNVFQCVFDTQSSHKFIFFWYHFKMTFLAHYLLSDCHSLALKRNLLLNSTQTQREEKRHFFCSYKNDLSRGTATITTIITKIHKLQWENWKSEKNNLLNLISSFVSLPFTLITTSARAHTQTLAAAFTVVAAPPLLIIYNLNAFECN